MTIARSQPLVCGQCLTPLPWAVCNVQHQRTTCIACGAVVQAHCFPVFFERPAQGAAASAAVPREDATCFYHDTKQAVAICDQCGRLLCALCDIDMHNAHRCPACIESGRAKGKLTQLESRRIMHDNIALLLAISPLVIGWLGMLVAPAAIFYAIFRWRAPGSLLPRSKFRFVLAILLALLSMSGFGLFIAASIMA